MVDIPFGISRLDSVLDGGVPAGTVVVLATEPGAGGRKFAHTSAAMNALATTDNQRFERYYRGMKAADVIVPPTVQYLSIAATKQSLEAILSETVSDEIAASASAAIEYQDFAPQYFGHTDVPPAWYLGGAASTPSPLADDSTAEEADATTGEDKIAVDEIDPHEENNANEEAAADDAMSTDPFDYPATDDASQQPAESTAIVPALREWLGENAAGNLVVIDAITDLAAISDGELAWNEVLRLVQGLTRAAAEWGGLVLIVADSEALTPTELGGLSAAASGTLRFSWEASGSERARVLDVRELRGALSAIDHENLVQYESELHDRGYDLSNVRKIR